MINSSIQAFIFDLDGTIYLGDDLIPGAKQTLEWVREQDAAVRFVTNNPRFSRQFYTEKLNNLGIGATEKEIVTSANFTAYYLRENPQYGKVYVIGEEQLMTELRDAGIEIVDTDPDTVIVSFDTALTYEKLMIAYQALRKGARFIATNPDTVCPTPDGGLVDAGAIIAALEASTERKLQSVIGKPSALLGNMLAKQLDVKSNQCMVIGDRLNTDVQLAKNSGMIATWINSAGEEVPSDCNHKPDIVINSIADLPEKVDDFLKKR